MKKLIVTFHIITVIVIAITVTIYLKNTLTSCNSIRYNVGTSDQLQQTYRTYLHAGWDWKRQIRGIVKLCYRYMDSTKLPKNLKDFLEECQKGLDYGK